MGRFLPYLFISPREGAFSLLQNPCVEGRVWGSPAKSPLRCAAVMGQVSSGPRARALRVCRCDLGGPSGLSVPGAVTTPGWGMEIL